MSSRHNTTTERISVGAVLIVKNEEAVLDECLSALAWTDEIVVYDTGSTDATRDIARRHTPLVVEGYWDDDFGEARNRALAHSTCDWVISIDADEVLTCRPRGLRKFLSHNRWSTVGVRIVNLGDIVASANDFVASRIFRRANCRWVGRVHEQLVTTTGSQSQRPVAPEAMIRHSGYRAEVIDSRDKVTRNRALAEAAIADAIANGDEQAAATATVQLARTIIGSRDWRDALDLAEESWQSPLSPAAEVSQVARMLGIQALTENDLEMADVWVQRWQQLDPGPDPLVAAVRVAYARGNPQQALALLESLSAVPAASLIGATFDRAQIADLEFQVLWANDRHAEAAEVLASGMDAVALQPQKLLPLLGPEQMADLIARLKPPSWHQWALTAAAAAGPDGLAVLDLMHAHRPDDSTVILAAPYAVGSMDFEQAAQWEARYRALGASEGGPLMGFAGDESRPARERALAAALLISGYQDTDAVPLLEEALDTIPHDQEERTAAELEIVAPGLVSAG